MGNSKRNLLSLYTPSGVGDMHWTFLKLQELKKYYGCKINIFYEKNPYHNPEGLLMMIPFVDKFGENRIRDPRFFNKYPSIEEIINKPECDTFSFWIGKSIVKGIKKVDDILPWIKTNYDYDINIPENVMTFARSSVKDKPLIITNASWRSVDKHQVADTWKIEYYKKTAKLFYDEYGVKTFLLGNSLEIDLANEICKDNNYFYNYAGLMTLQEVIALISDCDLIWGFQGGLSMIADRFKVPIVMLWPISEHTGAKHNAPKNLIHAWVRPESIDNGRYRPLILGKNVSPESIFKNSKELINGLGSKRFC